MTQTKNKKIKYASKVEEQIADAIKSGKSLSGKDGILTPIIKRALETALEGEMHHYVNESMKWPQWVRPKMTQKERHYLLIIKPYYITF